MNPCNELRKPEVAAAVGAVSALVVATVVPAAVLLTVGAATVGGVYLYHWKFGKNPYNAGTDTDVDTPPRDAKGGDVKKENGEGE